VCLLFSVILLFVGDTQVTLWSIYYLINVNSKTKNNDCSSSYLCLRNLIRLLPNNCSTNQELLRLLTLRNNWWLTNCSVPASSTILLQRSSIWWFDYTQLRSQLHKRHMDAWSKHVLCQLLCWQGWLQFSIWTCTSCLGSWWRYRTWCSVPSSQLDILIYSSSSQVSRCLCCLILSLLLLKKKHTPHG